MIYITGKIESVGKTTFSQKGVDIRTPDGSLISIPLPDDSQIRDLAMLLFQDVTITIQARAQVER